MKFSKHRPKYKDLSMKVQAEIVHEYGSEDKSIYTIYGKINSDEESGPVFAGSRTECLQFLQTQKTMNSSK